MDNDINVVEATPVESIIHQKRPTQAGIKEKRTDKIVPNHNIGITGPIEFTIPCGNDEMIDASSISLELKLRIVKQDGSALASVVDVSGTETPNPNAYVIPVNMISTALFKDLEVKLDNKIIQGTDGYYAYKADLEARLFTNIHEKEHLLSRAGYYAETKAFEDYIAAGYLNKAVGFEEKDNEILAKARDKGLAMRWFKTKDSKEWNVRTCLYGGIFQQRTWLPPGKTLELTFTRNDPKFYLLTNVPDQDFRIQIVSAELFVEKGIVEEGYLDTMKEEMFGLKNSKYVVPRTQITKFSRSSGRSELAEGNYLIDTTAPRRIFYYLVGATNFHGNYTKDPFNYRHNFVFNIHFTVNGTKDQNSEIEMDFARNNFGQGIDHLNRAIGAHYSGTADPIGINIDNFAHRNAFYGYDVSGLAAGPMANCLLKSKSVAMGLYMRTSIDTTEELMMMLHSEYDSAIGFNFETKSITKHDVA